MEEQEKTSATAITQEIDIPAFRAGLFMWGANILSPVEIVPKPGLVNLEEAFEQAGNLIKQYFPWIVTGGIGLYSLIREPAGILARFDTIGRNATENERQEDLRWYGEQVTGPEVGSGEDEEYKHNARVKIWDKEFYYVGPPRLVKARFATRAFSGDLPAKEGIIELAKQVDELGLKAGREIDGETINQGYRLFHAVKGKIYHTGFGKVEDYDPDKMNSLWAEVEVTKTGDIMYYPQGERGNEKDFSQLFEDLPADIARELRQTARRKR
ncbi:MAG: hypothetical protein MUF61_02570 [archaeon]|jgi:hypothetical protein|nr:hypothetical protein [archaeon]